MSASVLLVVLWREHVPAGDLTIYAVPGERVDDAYLFHREEDAEAYHAASRADCEVERWSVLGAGTARGVTADEHESWGDEPDEDTPAAITDGQARRIAEVWACGEDRGAIAALFLEGRITADLGSEIGAHLSAVRRHPGTCDDPRQGEADLLALAAYARAHGPRGRVDGWESVAIDDVEIPL